MNFRKARMFILFIVGLVLLGCSATVAPSLAGNNLSSPVPVTRVGEDEGATAVPNPTPTFDPIPYGVSCSKFEDVPEDNSYWTDSLIPGESVYEEAQALIEDLPSDEKANVQIEALEGQLMTVNLFDNPYRLFFNDDGVLVVKEDPRIYLGDILYHFGVPDQVTWRTFSGGAGGGLVTVEPAQDTTTLFFHQSHAVFVGLEKIVDFWGNVSFYGSVYMPSHYDELFAEANNEASTSRMLVRHSPWPCD